jgi:chromate transporter
MKDKLKFYFKLFTSTFYLSAFTFGGGYVIIPLMRKKFVDEYKWIDEKEMIDLIAIGQSSPGAIAVNVAILIGYRLAGILGSLITILGTVLPPLIILSVISIAYSAFIENLIVQYVLRGMQAGVAAVIADVVFGMSTDLIKEKKVLPIVVMLAAFVAAYLFEIDVVIIILVSGILGALSVFISKFVKKRREGKKKIKQ